MDEHSEMVESVSTLPGPLPSPRSPGPACGARYGRFIVERMLGGGGMGVVLLARDPELGRKVALKLLRPELSHAWGPERLVREAQAMARVAHPNVVPVFEVGRSGAQVFVAMELVEGETLWAWMRAAERPWREVLAMFVAAGRGLVAAHAAGLVHRDFKPGNVLVGRDGRPRVTDFGVVSEDAPVDRAAAADRAVRSELIAGGVPLGTPAYMSAEQWAGGRVDARSDQFSFCVALWEALYGAKPFGGATPGQLEASVRAEAIVAPRGRRGVPAWVEPYLRRGLARDPDGRWPDLGTLLDELTRRSAPRPRLGRTRGLAAVAIAAGALATVLVLRGESSGPPLERPIVVGADPSATRRTEVALRDQVWASTLSGLYQIEAVVRNYNLASFGDPSTPVDAITQLGLWLASRGA